MTTLTHSDEIAAVAPGSRSRFRLPVARRSSGEELAISGQVVRGRSPGASLLLIANVHGDAIFGAEAVNTALARLDPEQLAGSVIGVPVANPVAFESGTRATGQGWNTDMNNMNRVFPGTRQGWVTQKMAAVISEEIIPHIDAMIDYHCAGDTSINYTLVNSDRTPEQKRIFDFTRLMGTDFVFVHDVDPFAGTIDQYVKSLGKLSIVAEQGGNVMPEGFAALTQTRIDNFLKGLGIIDGVPELPEKQLLMRERVLIRADHGGLCYPSVGIEGLSAVVDGGTLLSRIVDAHTGDTLQEIRAPYEKSAILQTRPGFSRVNPGEYMYIIADAGSGEWIAAPEQWRLEV
ncbi:succinylglutamate desuccinylase/aspartoacylase family protein [Jiangella sp. DSM 45060]|uniref:succinylglutamate desuccinylase/aspartoacylase family protein n=1 Tax=Jiangella sp. DSM 45060 TaxID=1798224 RepID=UPI00087BDD02|nr:M14 family metallopeptidase [Jiangella sp. DSM 45060]SDT10920.1 hypothetical protein SAMN04515669_2806 [Jiangella sp. DSM 45060]